MKELGKVKTFEAKIFVGLREGYSGSEHAIWEVENICQKYCDEIGLGVTVTPTNFVYTNGNEQGAIIGLIRYPRFDKHPDEIKDITKKLGKLLAVKFCQERFSIVYTDETFTYEMIN